MKKKSKITYARGVDEKADSNADFVSYGISKLVDGKIEHENIINVHGDPLLRDAIVHLLATHHTIKLPRMATIDPTNPHNEPRFADHVTGSPPFRPFGDKGVDVAGRGTLTAEEFEQMKRESKHD